MGEFSCIFLFSVTQEVSETLSQTHYYTFSMGEQKHGKRAENGEIVLPLFCVKHEYFTGNKGCKRAKLQQFSTVEILYGFALGY